MTEKSFRERQIEELKKNASQEAKIDYLLDLQNEMHDVIFKDGLLQKVSKNTIRSKGTMWFIGAVITGGITALITLM